MAILWTLTLILVSVSCMLISGFVYMVSILLSRVQEKVFGKIASKFLEGKLGERCKIRTRKDGKGKYGRILGEFVVYDPTTDSEMTVNDIMIRDHYAVAYFGQSKEDIEEEHIINRAKLAEHYGHPSEDGQYTQLKESFGLDF